MKRATDLMIAAVLVVVTAPFMALIAAAVRLDSPGPIIFRQVRIGRDGRPFRIHKFRTMSDAASGLRITTAGDSRVTRTGRILRATKLDELPQLFDVLSGAMSLVGPRPEVPEYVRRWPAGDGPPRPADTIG
jgi:lipopolysaccharide/colanic/teichoic acid biosynthesis glycosyltransferase